MINELPFVFIYLIYCYFLSFLPSFLHLFVIIHFLIKFYPCHIFTFISLSLDSLISFLPYSFLPSFFSFLSFHAISFFSLFPSFLSFLSFHILSFLPSFPFQLKIWITLLFPPPHSLLSICFLSSDLKYLPSPPLSLPLFPPLPSSLPPPLPSSMQFTKWVVGGGSQLLHSLTHSLITCCSDVRSTRQPSRTNRSALLHASVLIGFAVLAY